MNHSQITRSLIEPNNSPFEYEATGVKAVRRLWTYLVLQERLSSHFIRYIYGKSPAAIETKQDRSSMTTSSGAGPGAGGVTEAIKIIQREHEAILGFACNAIRPEHIVVSTGRELQEINLEKVFEERNNQSSLLSSSKQSTTSFLNNRVELDIQLQQSDTVSILRYLIPNQVGCLVQLQRDALRDNDDYQLITEGGKARVQGSSYVRLLIELLGIFGAEDGLLSPSTKGVKLDAS